MVMRNARRRLAAGFLACTAVAACGGSKTTTSSSPSCEPVASAEALCGGRRDCDTTWSAVQTDDAYCSANPPDYLAGDCGDYHMLTYLGLDSGGTYFYRRDTGALVAATFWAAPSPTGTCTVVGAETFPSVDCPDTAFAKLPGWCPGDAGAD